MVDLCLTALLCSLRAVGLRLVETTPRRALPSGLEAEPEAGSINFQSICLRLPTYMSFFLFLLSLYLTPCTLSLSPLSLSRSPTPGLTRRTKKRPGSIQIVPGRIYLFPVQPMQTSAVMQEPSPHHNEPSVR